MSDTKTAEPAPYTNEEIDAQVIQFNKSLVEFCDVMAKYYGDRYPKFKQLQASLTITCSPSTLSNKIIAQQVAFGFLLLEFQALSPKFTDFRSFVTSAAFCKFLSGVDVPALLTEIIAKGHYGTVRNYIVNSMVGLQNVYTVYPRLLTTVESSMIRKNRASRNQGQQPMPPDQAEDPTVVSAAASTDTKDGKTMPPNAALETVQKHAAEALVSGLPKMDMSNMGNPLGLYQAMFDNDTMRGILGKMGAGGPMDGKTGQAPSSIKPEEMGKVLKGMAGNLRNFAASLSPTGQLGDNEDAKTQESMIMNTLGTVFNLPGATLHTDPRAALRAKQNAEKAARQRRTDPAQLKACAMAAHWNVSLMEVIAIVLPQRGIRYGDKYEWCRELATVCREAIEIIAREPDTDKYIQACVPFYRKHRDALYDHNPKPFEVDPAVHGIPTLVKIRLDKLVSSMIYKTDPETKKKVVDTEGADLIWSKIHPCLEQLHTYCQFQVPEMLPIGRIVQGMMNRYGVATNARIENPGDILLRAMTEFTETPQNLEDLKAACALAASKNDASLPLDHFINMMPYEVTKNMGLHNLTPEQKIQKFIGTLDTKMGKTNTTGAAPLSLFQQPPTDTSSSVASAAAAPAVASPSH